MSDAIPRRARRRRPPRGEHHLIVRTRPNQHTNVRALADALILHATALRAQAEGTPVPHLAGLHKLSRTTTREEGDDE